MCNCWHAGYIGSSCIRMFCNKNYLLITLNCSEFVWITKLRTVWKKPHIPSNLWFIDLFNYLFSFGRDVEQSWAGRECRGASGKLQAFGFCEYGDPDASLRAIRLLHELELGDKKLVVSMRGENVAFVCVCVCVCVCCVWFSKEVQWLFIWGMNSVVEGYGWIEVEP